jgi:hypothetical protein
VYEPRSLLANVLCVHATVTFWPEAVADGCVPVGMVAAEPDPEPEPSAAQCALAAAAWAASVSARSAGSNRVVRGIGGRVQTAAWGRRVAAPMRMG